MFYEGIPKLLKHHLTVTSDHRDDSALSKTSISTDVLKMSPNALKMRTQQNGTLRYFLVGGVEGLRGGLT